MYQPKSEWFTHHWMKEAFGIANLHVEIEQKIREEEPDVSPEIIPGLVALELVVRSFDRMHELAKAHYGR